MSDNMLSGRPLYKGECENKIEPETDLTRWRLSTVEGRQKWYYVPENEECAREQNALEAYSLGLNTSKFFPELPKASTAQEAVLKAIKFFSGVQAEDGHWPAECSGVLTLTPDFCLSLYDPLASLILRQAVTYLGARPSLHLLVPCPSYLACDDLLQLSRLSAEEDELIRSLRQELYVEDYSSIDWPAQKKYISEADLQAPHTLVLDVLFALFNLYDRYHLTSLRKKATAEIYELIKADDIFSNSTNSSPICKPFHVLISWHVDGPNSAAFQEHVSRIYDYLWLGDEGITMKAGIQNDPEYHTCLKKAHSFLKCSQIVDNPPNYQRYYRQMNKGGFPFSNRDNDWIVSDCTAEALKALMLLEEQCSFIDDHIAPQRLFDAVNMLLNMRNSDGGFSSYETRRGSWLLENINCAETYGKKKLSGVMCKIQNGDHHWNVASFEGIADCMVDHTYIECTSSVMQGLKYFQKRFPDHRREEISDTIHKALQYCRNTQKADGSWVGAACNEVTKGCAFLVSRQMKDGGWGEEFESYKFRKYIQHTISQIHQTAWALLGLMAVRYPDVHGDIATGFYKAGTLHYSAYRNIFPIFALARFTHLYPNSPLARQHLKTGPRHSTESQTVKH
ncbi:hypothetical protein Chor_003617 [Crotalus horridus]